MTKDIVTIDNNEYQQWLQHLCKEIDRKRLKAVMQLNAATLQHYWWLDNVLSKSLWIMRTKAFYQT